MRILRGVLTPIVSIALVFLFWDLIIRGFNVDTFVAPSPGETLAALRDNWSTLWPLALETIRETVYGFVVGAVLGFVLAVVMAQTKTGIGIVERQRRADTGDGIEAAPVPLPWNAA